MSSAATRLLAPAQARGPPASGLGTAGKRRAFRLCLLLAVGLEIVQPEPTNGLLVLHPGRLVVLISTAGGPG